MQTFKPKIGLYIYKLHQCALALKRFMINLVCLAYNSQAVAPSSSISKKCLIIFKLSLFIGSVSVRIWAGIRPTLDRHQATSVSLFFTFTTFIKTSKRSWMTDYLILRPKQDIFNHWLRDPPPNFHQKWRQRFRWNGFFPH